ncbi:MAG: PEPxxWA-CTERM sorting domain-containing protein [Sphingomonadales bacterium]|jgi:hypothetical protein
MKRLRSFAVAATASLLFAGAAGAVQPITTTFAQFAQRNSGNLITYTNTGAGNTLSASNAPVYFIISDFGPPSLTPVQMSLSATTLAPVNISGPTFQQSGYNGSISFTSGGTNYLTVNFINATLAIGALGGSGGLFSTDPSSPIAFTSDVLIIPPLAAADFSLAFTSITPLFQVAGNGFGKPFKAASVGSFAGAEDFGPGGGGVPEPASWAMMLGGFGLVGASARRRRVAVVAA